MRNALLSLFALAVFCLTPAAPAVAADTAPNLFQDADFAYRSLDVDQQRFLYNFVDSPTVETSRLVRPALPLKDIVGALRIELVSGEEVTVERTRFEERGENDYTWVGTVPGELTQAILVVNGEHLTGSVIAGTRYYAIRSIGGGLSVLALIDQKAFPADHPAGEYERLEQEAGPVSVPLTPGPEHRIPEAIRGIAARAGCGPVDVIVAYTPSASAQVVDMYGLLQTAVGETNQSYAASGILHEIRLVYSYLTFYTEDADIVVNRDRFSDDGDGYMDEIHTWRDTYSADVALLIQGTNDDSCGIAADIYADSSSAFAVVVQDCATGNYSFGHEIGHLHGARHNFQHDNNMTPFAYGHGLYYIPGGWRTVMAYDCPGGCTRMAVWSNPNATIGGVAAGTTSLENNARVLNQTCSYVAGFK